jgi:hypothetical protein
VGGLLFLAACFGFQRFKAQACSHKTWSSGEEYVPKNEYEKFKTKNKVLKFVKNKK